MTHLDLFSGVGGFAYAADQVWDNVEHIFCEIDPYCREVIKRHWPESKIYNDIRSITADTLGHQRQQGAAKSSQRQAQDGGKAAKKPRRYAGVDLLTGGFPCQPFSATGLRRGTADERHLWPEMLRVIKLAQPRWVIAENVRGILTWNDGLVFEQVCTDLEAAGYEVQPFIIPAVAVNAPHRRDRVWFIAHDNRPGLEKAGAEQQAAGSRRDRKAATNAPRQRRQRNRQQPAGRREYTDQDWSTDWSKIAAELCGLDNGLPGQLGSTIITPARHRKEQLKAYGNAIVPQVAVEIMQGML